MALVLVLVFGIIAALKIPLAYMPNYEQKRLHILVDYRNASAKAAERLILKPIEDAVASLNGLRYIYASAGRRGPQVSLNFYPHANIDELKAEVQDRIDRIGSRDERDRADLAKQRNELTTELAGVGRSRGAIAAYASPNSRTTNPRFQDRNG